MVRRAGASALLVVSLSLGFHLLGGGGPPDPATLLGVAALVAAVALPVTARGVRPPGLLLLLGSAQVVLHLAFEGGNGHGHDAAPVPMVVTHAVATALTALVLLRGRALVRRGWLRWSAAHLPRPVPRLPRCRLPVPVFRSVPVPAPGTSAVMGRAPPAPVRP